MEREILIGTSGWMYKHWNKTFYAEAGKQNQLEFYSREFNTVELNYSFYRSPGPKAYIDWHERTPAGFTFTVKLNRFLTHLKRLIIDDETVQTLKTFMHDTQGLKEKLACILIQLQPSQSADLNRLERFLFEFSDIVNTMQYKPSACIEFRNVTWFNDDVYRILRNYNIALVFPSTVQYRKLKFTSNIAFIRLHDNHDYTIEELIMLKNEIYAYPAEIERVFIYFNNDWNTYAIYNARELKKLLSEKQ